MTGLSGLLYARFVYVCMCLGKNSVPCDWVEYGLLYKVCGCVHLGKNSVPCDWVEYGLLYARFVDVCI